jgi:hypothetical protein
MDTFLVQYTVTGVENLIYVRVTSVGRKEQYAGPWLGHAKIPRSVIYTCNHRQIFSDKHGK